ncbi:MAG TPA: hypothetical protein VG713_14985 [Pirellulales bacterium]|nr:hypothetical protein [Pirellulales bacterium]
MSQLLNAIRRIEKTISLSAAADRLAAEPLVADAVERKFSDPPHAGPGTPKTPIDLWPPRTARIDPAPVVEVPAEGAVAPGYRKFAGELIERLGADRARSVALAVTDPRSDAAIISVRLAGALATIRRTSVAVVEPIRSAPVELNVPSGGTVMAESMAFEGHWTASTSATRLPRVARIRMTWQSENEPDCEALTRAIRSLNNDYRWVVVNLGFVDRRDALSWAATCDGACLGVAQGALTQADAKRMARGLKLSGAKLVGCVLLDPPTV